MWNNRLHVPALLDALLFHVKQSRRVSLCGGLVVYCLFNWQGTRRENCLSTYPRGRLPTHGRGRRAGRFGFPCPRLHTTTPKQRLQEVFCVFRKFVQIAHWLTRGDQVFCVNCTNGAVLSERRSGERKIAYIGAGSFLDVNCLIFYNPLCLDKKFSKSNFLFCISEITLLITFFQITYTSIHW